LAARFRPACARPFELVPIEIAEMHAHIRQCLAVRLGTEGKEVRILYGGSVNSSNARDILLPEVSGALVGGASPKAADFEGTCRVVSAKA
jgi:triosephosphate isomerase (TIM)